MKLEKKTFFKIHSWIGVRLSVLFFIVCFSGTLATLSHEMDWLFNTDSRATPKDNYIPRNEIVANFKKVYPEGSIVFWERSNERYLCDILHKVENGKRTYVFANPYTGAIQGEAQITIARFFRDLHYYLFIPFQIGHYTVLVFGFLLLISMVTALVFYKRWWRKLFKLRTNKGVLVFFRSLHRLIGVWSVPFTLLFSITGIWYFLERTNTAHIAELGNTRSPKTVLTVEEIDARGRYDTMTLDYDRAVGIAEEAIPGMVAGDMIPPRSYGSFIYITGKGDVPLVRQRANRVYLDPITYKPEKVQNAKKISAIMYLNDIADPLHFGYWGGLTTKIIWFLLGLGISSLVLSGIWITAKRKAQKRKKAKKKIMGPWWYVNWGIYVVMLFYIYYSIVNSYQASMVTLAIIGFGWAVFLLLSWYLFVYRLHRVVERTL